MISQKGLTKKEIEKLLDKQTITILTAVDQKISSLEKKIAKLELRVERRLRVDLD